MASLMLLLLLVLPIPGELHAATINSSQYINCVPSELQALRSFAASFSHATVLNSDYSISRVVLAESWVGQDCCSWVGVTCTSSHTHNIVVQNRSSNSLLHVPRVSELTLADLQLSKLNSIAGQHDILRPPCSLPFLSVLSLGLLASADGSSSSFFVALPDCLGDLFTLRTLNLISFNLKGPIPSSFSRLLNLQSLDLSDNPALSGSLLPISNLPNLTNIILLSSLSLSGPVPLPPFHTPLLQTLVLSSINSFNSTIIDNFIVLSDLPSLTRLDLPFNSISGSLPYSISRLSTLTHLDLRSNSLSGALPNWQSSLSSLTYLDLSSNSFSGALPHWLSRLSSLTYLDLSSNSLSGTLPKWVCNLTALASLDLSHNHLVGSTVDVLTQECAAGLSDLTYLSLSNNEFAGPFPPSIGTLHSLQILSLSSNNFSGALPEEWQNLQDLDTLYLSGNSIIVPAHDEQLPEWIFRLPKLGYLGLGSMNLKSKDLHCSTKLSLLNQTLSSLTLSDNLFTGLDLLSCFASHNFTQLAVLNLNGNPLSVLLKDIHLTPKIYSLELSSCSLKGNISNTFLESLNSSLVGSIDLSQNELVGEIPVMLMGQWESIVSMDLSHNELVGEIPATLMGQWGTNSRLNRVKLNHNHLVGRIPHELGALENLITLTLNNNHLQGTVPSSLFTSLSALQLLDLSHNNLQGNLNSLISSNFSNLQSLQVLLLSHNNLTGTIPSFQPASLFPALQLIDLSHNHLTGPIPQDMHLPSFEDIKVSTLPTNTLYEEVTLVVKGIEEPYTYILKVLTSLDLSSNHLIGSIPPQLGDLSGMMLLNLSHNSLSGSIPATLGRLSVLESLDLSNNMLEGPIPSDLSSLTKLGSFNVSFNKALTGKIPAGPQLEDSESYMGDPWLCGNPTLQACSELTSPVAENGAPTILEEKSGRTALAQWMDEWVSFGGVSLGIVVGFLGTLWLLHFPAILQSIRRAR